LGFLVLGFRQPGAIAEKHRELIRTLAGQAAALVEKSYLFAHAESGRRRLAAVLASTSEAVIVTDQTSRILIINRAMEQAFHVEAKEVTGRVVSHVIESPALANALAPANALSGQEPVARSLEIVGLDRRTYFANTSTIINHEGQAIGRVAVLHDITHLKEIDRIKSEFVDNVSHDLRTPLTILSGYASALALMDDLTSEQRQYTDNILRSVEQMISLIDNLLDLGRIEAGIELVTEEVDIGRLLQDLADEHWLFAHESGIRINVRAAENLPIVRCDQGLIRQAVSNLLTNGFKYAPQSGDMTLAAELSGDEVVISVRDRGPGIAKPDQVRLYEKFYRVKRHGSGAAKGSGLGLSMVRSIAERHGGRAWCHSELGKGSTFFISLPIEAEPEGPKISRQDLQ
jgi:PAS domain S-box-containing protein